MKHILCIIIPALLLLTSNAFCCTWVESVGEVVAETFTPAEAKSLALKTARLAAIEQVVGTRLVGSTIVKDAAFVGEYINTLAHGYVSEEKVLRWEQSKYQESPQSPPTPIVKVTLKACVEALTNKISDAFRVSAELDKPIFLEGERASLTIGASEKAFVNIFNLTAEDRVVYFHQPPQFTMPMSIEAGQRTSTFPGKGASLEMTVPAGFNSVTEAFIVVGTKEKVDFPLIYKGKTDMSLAEFYKGISTVHGVMAQELVMYSISKRGN